MANEQNKQILRLTAIVNLGYFCKENLNMNSYITIKRNF